MALAQLAAATAAVVAPAPASYHHAIRSVAYEQIGGEDTTSRVNALARYFGLDSWTIQADVDEVRDIILDL